MFVIITKGLLFKSVLYQDMHNQNDKLTNYCYQFVLFFKEF